MRRRFIITTSLAVILFAMCLFGINVYASMNQSFSISNKIVFNADENIYLTLECSVSGCKQSAITEYSQIPDEYKNQCNSINDYRELIGIIHKEEFSGDRDGTSNIDGGKWEIKESLEFIDADTEIVYTIKVTNYSFIPVKVSFFDYITNSTAIKNTVKEIQKLDGYVPGQAPKSAEITLTTKVRYSTKSFEDEPNNFSILVGRYAEV